MTSRYLLCASLCSYLLLPTLAHARPPASVSDRQKAVEHFKLGNQAFAEGDSLQAYTEYTAAWTLHESFDIACNLGRTEAELGKSRDAAEHLAYCLTNFSASARPEIRSAEGKLREVFAEVQTRVSSLTLRVEPDGAVVRIDGAIVGKTPLRSDLYLDPGQHEVDVRMAGYEPLRRVVNAARGERQELLLELAQGSGGEAPAMAASSGDGATNDPPANDAMSAGSSVSAPPSDARGVPTRTIALLTSGGLALVGLGVGGAYFLQARRLDHEAHVARRTADDALGRGGCGVDPEAPECVRLNDVIDDRDRARTLSTIGLAAGGVLALGTVAGYVWWPPTNREGMGPARARADEVPRVSWSPIVGRSEVSLVLWGRL